MRGADQKQEAMFSYISPEKRVPLDHPLRPVREMVDEVLKEMSPHFAQVYARVGRPSIAPERLLRALLLQIFYSLRSERLLMEQWHYHLLFRWFVGMEMDERGWDHAVFSQNRQRLLNEEIAEAFFQRVLKLAQPYLSDGPFTVDGTLIEAWASHKGFRPQDEERGADGGNGEVNFHGQRRSNETHPSTTDPDVPEFWYQNSGTPSSLNPHPKERIPLSVNNYRLEGGSFVELSITNRLSS
jgi:transposase